MKNLKNQKGITLVALVITIIVLLILAGVSLSLVVGDNGILGRASNSSEVQKAASAREAVELDVANLAAEFYQKKYVDNDTSASTIGAYIATKRSVATKLPGREDTYKVTVTSATSSETDETKKEYDVELVVKNATGNGDGTYKGVIDADGKWKTPIALPSYGD